MAFKTFQDFLNESVAPEVSLDKAEKLVRAVAMQIGNPKVHVDEHLKAIWFKFRGTKFYKDRKFFFEMRTLTNEMQITERTLGRPSYTSLKSYDAKNYDRVVAEMFQDVVSRKIDLKKLRGSLAGDKFDF